MIHKKDAEAVNEKKKSSGYKMSVKRSKIAGILLAIILVLVIIFVSPIFDVKTIKIEGNKINSSDVILQTSGIKKGDSIFFSDIDEAEKKLKSLKNVASAKVSRELPSTVVIEIVEKVEVACIPVGKSISAKSQNNTAQSISNSSASDSGSVELTDEKWEKYVCVDENALVLSVLSKAPEGIPLVTGIEITDTEKGQFIKIDDKLSAKEKSELLCNILTELKKQDIVAKIKEINIGNLKNIYMILDTDTLVNFGEDGDEDGDNIEYKIAFLKAILDEPRQNGGVIELSDTDNVTERTSR